MLAMPGIGQLSVSLPCRNIRNTGPAVPMLVFCLLDMHARVNVQTQQNSRREKKKTHETPQKIHSGTLRACALRSLGCPRCQPGMSILFWHSNLHFGSLKAAGY